MPIIRTYLHLHAYINFDWAGDPHTHKSIAGFFLGQTLISWCAKKKLLWPNHQLKLNIIP